MKYIFSQIFVSSFIFLLVIAPVSVMAQPLGETDLPENIQTLLQKDPATLSSEEMGELLPYLVPNEATNAGGQTSLSNEVVNCFDYYTFGSAQVFLTPSVTSAVSGSQITFSGTIQNNNPYPVVNGQLYVKIYNLKEFADGERINGYPVVDQYFVLDDVTIPANGSVPVSFDWSIPAHAQSGDYELNTFFMTEERFNLLGLPFTDDVTGNKINFSVLGEVTSQAAFDKNSVTVAGNPFRFAAFPPRVDTDEPVVITADVINDTAEAVMVPVTFTLYNWAGEREENKLDTKVEQVVLQAGERQTVTYTATQATGAVSFVRAEADYMDTKSILNIRFVRDDREEIRLNFPSVYQYPLVADTEATIFSCVHSTNIPYVSDSKLVMSVVDTSGEVIHSYTYEGGVTGEMMAVKDSFVPTQTLTDFDLVTTLYNRGTEVESVTMSYRCADINPNLCPTESVSDSPFPIWQIVAVGISILLCLFLLVSMYRNHRNRVSGTTFSLLICAVVAGGFVLGVLPQTTEAKSSTLTTNTPEALLYYYNSSPIYTTDSVPLETTTPCNRDNCLSQDPPGGWVLGLGRGSSAQVTYKARWLDTATNQPIADGTSVPVGTTLRLEQISPEDTDISWVGTGFSADSPYGHWVEDAGPLPNACNDNDFIRETRANVRQPDGSYVSELRYGIYILLNVNPPTPTFTFSNNLSCVGNTCVVNTVGPITAQIQFPPTIGRFYYRYYDHRTTLQGVDISNWVGCHANNVPMREAASYNNGIHVMIPGNNNPYTLAVPATAINFTANAVAAVGNPPAIPTINPNSTNNNQTGSAQTFSLLATDPDGDTLRYGIDWDMNGTVDQWVPGSGYVNSGISQNSSRTWVTTGSKTFQVLAQDSKGASSGFRQHTIAITLPPAAASLVVSGCSIPRGSSNCNGTAAWGINNGLAPFALRNITTNTGISTGVSGAGVSTLLRHGVNTITLSHNNGVVLQTRTPNASCNMAVDVWDGTRCVERPPVAVVPVITEFKPQRYFIRNNTSAILEWDIENIGSYTCELFGNGVSGTIISTESGSIETAVLNEYNRFRLACSDGSNTIERTTEVEVTPRYIEI